MNKIFIAIIVCITIALIGCEDFKLGDDFLDKPNSSDQTIDTVFTNKFYADQALNSCYSTLRDLLINGNRAGYRSLENLSDLLDGMTSEYHTGSMTASSSSIWHKLPSAEIRKIWTYLENVDNVPDMTIQEKELRKAEVKVILAYHYAELFRHYGGMPWIDHAYKPVEDIVMKRMTVEEHVQKVVQLCDQAAAVLPWTTTEGDYGRMTAAAAKALKFKILLHAASPLYNNNTPMLPESHEAVQNHIVWYGNYDSKRWQDALDAGLDFLQTNQDKGDSYKMVKPVGNDLDAYRNAFASGYLDRNNGEIIFPIQNQDIWGLGQRYFASTRFGALAPSLEFVNKFERIDGSLPDTSIVDHVQKPYFSSHKQGEKYAVLKTRYIRDPRLYETILVNGDKWQSREAEVYIGGREGFPGATSSFKSLTINGFANRKFVRDFKNEIVGKFFVNAYIRMPEIYLGIAECMAELNKMGTADKFGKTGFDYLNYTRLRVGLKPMVATDPGKTLPARIVLDTKEKQIEAILHERICEFAFEECRFHDINRRKLSAQMNFSRHYISTDKLADKNFKVNILKSVNVYAWCENWDNKYYLLPIEANEIQKGYGLVQNPGWE